MSEFIEYYFWKVDSYHQWNVKFFFVLFSYFCYSNLKCRGNHISFLKQNTKIFFWLFFFLFFSELNSSSIVKYENPKKEPYFLNKMKYQIFIFFSYYLSKSKVSKRFQLLIFFLNTKPIILFSCSLQNENTNIILVFNHSSNKIPKRFYAYSFYNCFPVLLL